MSSRTSAAGRRAPPGGASPRRHPGVWSGPRGAPSGPGCNGSSLPPCALRAPGRPCCGLSTSSPISGPCSSLTRPNQSRSTIASDTPASRSTASAMRAESTSENACPLIAPARASRCANARWPRAGRQESAAVKKKRRIVPAGLPGQATRRRASGKSELWPVPSPSHAGAGTVGDRPELSWCRRPRARSETGPSSCGAPAGGLGRRPARAQGADLCHVSSPRHAHRPGRRRTVCGSQSPCACCC